MATKALKALSVMNNLKLQDYLGARDLTDHLSLNSELSFHWANWDQTCLAQRAYCQNFNKNLHFVRMNQTLQELKSRPVWLRNKVKVIKTDRFSLYESYLDSRLRLTWFQREEEILFSYKGEEGPYYTLTSMKWLDKDIYAQFIMRKILLEHYTLRSFRLNATIPILIKTNNDLAPYGGIVSIHQLSETGLILKITDKNFLNKIKNSAMLELSIPIMPYKGVGHLKLDEALQRIDENDFLRKEKLLFKLESRILNFYENLSNAKRSSDEEFYIFARYENLIPVEHDAHLKGIFVPLIEKAKTYLGTELKKTHKLVG